MPLDGTTFDYDDPVLRTLVRADELLSDESRWWKDGSEKATGHLCIMNAISEAAGNTFGDAHVLVLRELGLGAYSLDEAFGWNDAPETTFADVKGVLAKAISHRRAELAQEAVG